MVAFGIWDPLDSQLVQSLPPAAVRRLVRQGVRAEVCGTLLGADGREVSVLADQLLAISSEQLRDVGEVVAVAGGPSKAAAVKSALASGLISSLVTDESVAKTLLG